MKKKIGCIFLDNFDFIVVSVAWVDHIICQAVGVY